MKRSLVIFVAGIALVVVLILIPLIFTEQTEGGKLTSWRVAPPPPPATEAAKPVTGTTDNGTH